MSVYSKSTNRHKIFYALPAFVLAFPTIPVFVLLPTFYAQTVGLGLTAVGSALLVIRFLDVISDPLLGWLSDRIPIRFGKRKLPIAIGGLIGGPALIALFSPPENAGIVYFSICCLLLFLAWTAIQIPYLAWSAELEPDYHQRTILNGYREAFGIFGILFIAGIGIMLAQFSEAQRFATIAWVTVICGLVTFIIALKWVPQGAVRETRISISFPRENKLFLRVLSAWFINALANGLPAVCLPLYLTHILQVDEQAKAILLFVYFLFALLGIPLWMSLADRHNKHHVWCFSMIAPCVVFACVPFLEAGAVHAFAVVCAVTGLALGSDLSLPPSIQADCYDWDRYRFKKVRVATLFAYWSMATKMALGLAVGIAFPVLDFFQLELAAPAALVALIVIYAGLPVVLKMIAIIMMWNFPLGRRKHKAIQNILEGYE